MRVRFAARRHARRIQDIVIATLREVREGAVAVDVGGTVLPARTLVPLDEDATGRDAAVAFEQGRPDRPVVLGLLQEPRGTVHARVDGETVTIRGRREIVLRCGKASITLTSAGKILLRGAYVSSRSTGVNRVRGGSVQIN